MGFPPPRRRRYILAIIFVVILLWTVYSGPERPPTEYFLHPALDNQPRHKYPTVFSWESGTVPQTSITAHAPGMTIFERLYVYKGIVYVVTDNKEKIPDISTLYSKGIFGSGGLAWNDGFPSENDIQIVTSEEANNIFGTRSAVLLDGLTFFVNEAPQYIRHYFHWTAELWFILWRTYTSLDIDITANGSTTLLPPKRLAFIRFHNQHWRDGPGLNPFVAWSAFPSLVMEFVDDWRDRAELNVPYVYQQVVLVDRFAAMEGDSYHKCLPGTGVECTLPGSKNWWMPIRHNVALLAGADTSDAGGRSTPLVITYVSRQSWIRRRLNPEDQKKLVEELHKLRDRYGYEVNVVEFSTISRQAQLQLAARTTIMLGVHGNGLTHLVWMNPSPRTTVMEFFVPQGFSPDYANAATAIGITHYGWWGSEYFTEPNVPLRAYPDGFQGTEIPIDGEKVAKLCHERLSIISED